MLRTLLWCILLPFIFLFRWLLVAIGPALHLSNYVFSWMMIPLKFLAKFETIYIYLGVAALIGLITGSILHLSSAILVSMLSLDSQHEEKRSSSSLQSAEQANFEESWRNSRPKGHRDSLIPDDSLEKRYAEWLEKSRGKNKEDQSLFGQTILEEEDDFENRF